MWHPFSAINGSHMSHFWVNNKFFLQKLISFFCKVIKRVCCSSKQLDTVWVDLRVEQRTWKYISNKAKEKKIGDTGQVIVFFTLGYNHEDVQLRKCILFNKIKGYLKWRLHHLSAETKLVESSQVMQSICVTETDTKHIYKSTDNLWEEVCANKNISMYIFFHFNIF